jgi:prepilin-type N-terminal cleavage/methylation domain-containing protein
MSFFRTRWRRMSAKPIRNLRAGFSLVELLIVISIIALLAAFLLPGLSRAREYAYFTTCKNGLRQISIAFLCYAGNGKGRLPGTEGVYNQCTPTTADPNAMRKCGTITAFWLGDRDGDPRFYYAQLLEEVYDRRMYNNGWYTGTDWEGVDLGNRKWFGDARSPGTYLPIESLWDPIVGVRSWGEWGNSIATPDKRMGYAGSEQERDRLTRRNMVIGYAMYTHTTGCTMNRSDHMLPATGSTNLTEAPFRPYTKSRTIATAHKPSAWVATCLTPLHTYGYERQFRSHFGYRETVPGGFRFNIGHLDGHVDDTVWKDLPDGLRTHLITDSKSRPYGWPYKYRWYGGGGWAWVDGIVEEPVFDGAFDCNP